MDLKEMRKLLVDNSYKITKQREIIFNVLNENQGNHLSPEDLHELASKYDKEIGIATVYRTLVIFDKLNIVHKLDFDDNRYRYEIIREDDYHQHHHLLCKNCGKIIEVEEDYLEDLEKIIEEKYLFKVSNHDLKFYGECSECSKLSK
ncbi:MAG: Fur family transcriptional regulator [Peptoniphilaceae bacterium]|uniref:Fur family transcriptional regulator n=1 Tax=Parvimonas sp. TaxID=1944660 RepID=UPI0025D80D0E|nr:Fur family transcriptional regulator [Parvimonas sp.]MCI5997633.1 transcriptional repressor [Parvimonas sp.]MDD7765325.1 Fur family transcriptional regulator [Peptoniphilaceae bacterium]MDY3051244.1 Fur family transcriptional regulator [Parvimonas sp.]